MPSKKNISDLSEILGLAQAELSFLADNFTEATAFLTQCPVPCWIKHWPTLKMLYINTAYQDKFNVNIDNYVGNNDSVVWDPEISDRYRKNDAVAAKTKKPYFCKEIIAYDEGQLVLHVVKWPLFKGATVTAIAGMVVEIENRPFWERDK